MLLGLGQFAEPVRLSNIVGSISDKFKFIWQDVFFDNIMNFIECIKKMQKLLSIEK